MTRGFLIAGAALLVFGGAAGAADMSAPYSAPVPVSPAYDWSGFYIGAMGGYGWTSQVNVGGLVTSSSDLRGGFAGGTVGYNWQAGSGFVIGFEADGGWSGIKYQETVGLVTLADKITALGSVTGRIGYAAGPALIYAKGGYAFANNELSGSIGALTRSESKMFSGWTAGGGLEVLFGPNWSAKGEYMYSDFGTATYLQSLGGGGVTLGATVHTVKAGINYHFR